MLYTSIGNILCLTGESRVYEYRRFPFRFEPENIGFSFRFGRVCAVRVLCLIRGHLGPVYFESLE